MYEYVKWSDKEYIYKTVLSRKAKVKIISAPRKNSVWYGYDKLMQELCEEKKS